jgi:division protein CdvB (Snf7/Vps24/ESCRT-III family)
MLGYIRNKFSSIPIPGETIQLNGTALVTEAKAEQKDLREELSKILDDTTYDKLSEKDAATAKSVSEIQSYVPNLIFVG